MAIIVSLLRDELVFRMFFLPEASACGYVVAISFIGGGNGVPGEHYRPGASH